jgi:hypothetical protein
MDYDKRARKLERKNGLGKKEEQADGGITHESRAAREEE